MVLLCQQANPSKADEGQEWIPQKTKPSSYSLKTCLFSYMEFSSAPWEKKDILSHCIGILEIFINHPGIHLKSFFNPNLKVEYINHEALAVCSQIRDRLRSWLTVD